MDEVARSPMSADRDWLTGLNGIIPEPVETSVLPG